MLNKGCEKGKNVSQKVALDLLFNPFKNLNNVENDIDVVLPKNISEYNTVINQSICEQEVVTAIKSLKNNKACSDDMILNEFLKHAACKLMPVFLKIFNMIVFDSGIHDQRVLSVLFLKKNGDPANADNYRGISILSCY